MCVRFAGSTHAEDPTLDYYTKLAASVKSGLPFEYGLPEGYNTVQPVKDEGPLKPQIIVTVIAGQSLIPKDDSGLSDPYCVVKYGNSKFQTEVCNQTLNPVWGKAGTAGEDLECEEFS